MEENKEIQGQESYTPRPRWQVWAARAGVILALLAVAYQVLSIAGGGL